MTLLELIDTWLYEEKETTVKRSTYDRLLTSVNALNDFVISSLDICEILPSDFRQYVRELVDAEYSQSTIKKMMEIVSAPMRYAFHEGLISRDPCAGVKPPSKDRILTESKAIEAYTPDEQDDIRPVLESRERPGYAAIELMMETGLRVGEALALRWSDIDLRKRQIFVRATVVRLANKRQSYVQNSPKSKSSNRVVPMSRRAVDILQELSRGSTSGYVFTNEYGERLSYEALRYQCQRACQEADIPYLGLHVWRHTFATNLYYKGVDVKILSKILGHADTAITYNTYIHLYGNGFEEMLHAVS